MSKLALKLIKENKRTRATFLDLGSCGEVPAEVVELVWLERLTLSRTQMSDLGPLSGLTALQLLDVSGTQVSDLGPLSGLTALQWLDVSDTQVIDLEPLSGLTALQTLYVSRTQVSDLGPLSGLTALQLLDVSGTQVSDLGPLSGLTVLQSLYAAHTQVSDLSPLTPLIGRGCPVRWSSETLRGPGIYVEYCPLTTPPPEIVKQGSDAIFNYFEERRRGGIDHLYEAKMLILGEGGAGKTSLLRRLYEPDKPLPTEKETTKCQRRRESAPRRSV